MTHPRKQKMEAPLSLLKHLFSYKPHTSSTISLPSSENAKWKQPIAITPLKIIYLPWAHDAFNNDFSNNAVWCSRSILYMLCLSLLPTEFHSCVFIYFLNVSYLIALKKSRDRTWFQFWARLVWEYMVHFSFDMVVICLCMPVLVALSRFYVNVVRKLYVHNLYLFLFMFRWD